MEYSRRANMHRREICFCSSPSLLLFWDIQGDKPPQGIFDVSKEYSRRTNMHQKKAVFDHLLPPFKFWDIQGDKPPHGIFEVFMRRSRRADIHWNILDFVHGILVCDFERRELDMRNSVSALSIERYITVTHRVRFLPFWSSTSWA